MYGSTFSWSLDRIADLLFNCALLAWILLGSVAIVLQWVRRGRIESCYSHPDLIPNWLRRWIPGGSDRSLSARHSGIEITAWGWLLFACVTAWVIAKAI